MPTNGLIQEQKEVIPPLEPGDRLTSDEFRRRYHAMQNCKKAELIEGIVYMPSPVRLANHGEPHLHLSTWIGTYVASTAIVRGADSTTDRLDRDNEPQPDCMLFIRPELGGQVRVRASKKITSATDLLDR